MNRVVYKQNKWIRLTFWLLLALTFLVTPAASIAAPTEPEATDINPSAYVPQVHNHVCAGTRDSSNPFGTQVYGATGYKQSEFIALQKSQSAWLRNIIEWPAVEPTNRPPSEYRWNSADAAVRAATENCLNLLITVEETPDWAATEGHRSPIKTEALDDYVEFVTALVERYDGDGVDDAPSGAVVNYWEFYNEPDMGNKVPGEEGWGFHGARYAAMLAAIYDPIHDANPNAKVVMGGIAYDLLLENNGLFVRDFFQNVLDAGGGEHFDIMNFHYYPFQHNRANWTQSNTSGLMEKWADIKARLEAKGLANKPVMVTEIGWHSNHDEDFPSTPDFQGRQLVQLSTQSMAIGSMTTIWWRLVDDDREETNFPYATGLVTINVPHVAKPSYTVYVEASQRLGSSDYVGAYVDEVSVPPMDPDLEVYKFKDSSDKFFYVAWLNPVSPYSMAASLTFDDTKTQDLQVPGSIANIFSKEGSLKQTVHDEDGNGMVTVTVGRNPIYIVID